MQSCDLLVSQFLGVALHGRRDLTLMNQEKYIYGGN
jgi:hypothetical protein